MCRPSRSQEQVKRSKHLALVGFCTGRSPSISALLSVSLVETATDGVIAANSREAEALRAEREAVIALVQSDALNADPTELEELADTIESTGAIARLFSGTYKAAWRRAARFCTDSSDRIQVASHLRRAASYVRARRTFHNESKAQALFPAMLWNGHDSDFVSLAAARTMIREAATQLATVDEAGALRGWLTADESERGTGLGKSR